MAKRTELRLEAQNYAGMRRVDWRPSGVCVLCGPHGSGKSALLKLAMTRSTLSMLPCPAKWGAREETALNDLLKLSAIWARSEPDSVLAFDDVGAGLHPQAVKWVVDAMRDVSSQMDVTILLATHSPAVLGQFNGEHIDQVFVVAPGAEVNPVPLLALRTREWLEHYDLGDLFAAGEFGWGDSGDSGDSGNSAGRADPVGGTP